MSFVRYPSCNKGLDKYTKNAFFCLFLPLFLPSSVVVVFLLLHIKKIWEKEIHKKRWIKSTVPVAILILFLIENTYFVWINCTIHICCWDDEAYSFSLTYLFTVILTWFINALPNFKRRELQDTDSCFIIHSCMLLLSHPELLTIFILQIADEHI